MISDNYETMTPDIWVILLVGPNYSQKFFFCSNVIFLSLIESQLAYEIGLSLPIGPCDNTAPRATSEASVITKNSYVKSGYCKSGLLIKISLIFCKAVSFGVSHL